MLLTGLLFSQPVHANESLWWAIQSAIQSGNWEKVEEILKTDSTVDLGFYRDRVSVSDLLKQSARADLIDAIHLEIEPKFKRTKSETPHLSLKDAVENLAQSLVQYQDGREAVEQQCIDKLKECLKTAEVAKRLFIYNQWSDRQEKDPLNPEMVTLQSSEGEKFSLRARIARQSETLTLLLKDAGTGNIIPLPDIKKSTLELICILLEDLDKSVHEAELNSSFYIPRHFKQIAADAISKIASKANLSFWETFQLVCHTFLAAHYLDIPHIVNTTAGLIVDHILKENPNLGLQRLLTGLRDNAVELEHVGGAKSPNHARFLVRLFSGIPKDLSPYLVRHLVFRSCEILEEFSIADAVMAQRYQGPDFFKFRGVTSLYGLNLPVLKGETVVVKNSCLGDLSLDPQFKANALQGLELFEIKLKNNQITRLPRTFLNGISELSMLDLSKNEIQVLPDQISSHPQLPLEFLDLSGNFLRAIPDRFFLNLTQLQRVLLQKNRLTQIPDLSSLPDQAEVYLGDNKIPDSASADLPHKPVVYLKAQKFAKDHY